MSDEEALLRAIYANHDEDTPRLVYADWLDEHGQPERAEFIRVQVQVARPESADDYQRLRGREQELLTAHLGRWTAQVGLVNSENCEVEFLRGFTGGLVLRNGTPKELEVVGRLPLLRWLRLEEFTLKPSAVRELAKLELDELTITDTPFRREWLKLLEPLPCGTVIRIDPADGPFDPTVWDAFHERRMAKLATLTPSARRAEAVRWVRANDEDRNYRPSVVTGITLNQQSVCDAELRLIAELPEVEVIYASESDITAAGVAHLAQLPRLKELKLFEVRVESITPLAGCITLENLQLYPDFDIVVRDAGTAGLENLINLRDLTLRDGYSDGGYGDATLARLAFLRKLQSLDIDLRSVESEESYAALSHLAVLEKLNVSFGEVPGGALQYLAPLRRLMTLQIRVSGGSSDDFRHLASLTDVDAIYLSGDAVRDAAIVHLAPLKNLRTLVAQGSAITAAGARALADQLSAVTIILDKVVVKSPRKAITFQRAIAAEFASVLLPAHWSAPRTFPDSNELWRLEDGWKGVSSVSEAVSAAELLLRVRDGDSETALREHLRGHNPKPRNIERNVVELSGKDTASCIYTVGRNQCLIAVAASEGKCAVLFCCALKARFDEFRPMFEYVARSLRVSKAAMKDVSEEKTVAVSKL